RVARAQVIGEALPAATLVFTNGPYESPIGGNLPSVDLRLAREDKPQNDTAVTMSLAQGYTFSDGEGGSRVFKTDDKGTISVRGINVPNAVGTSQITANSAGASQAIAQVNVVKKKPLEFIDMGSIQLQIVITNDGAQVYVELLEKIAVIATSNNQVTGYIPKPEVAAYTQMFITPDGKKIYAREGKHILVFDAIKYSLIRRIPAYAWIAMSADGRLASQSANGKISIIDTKTDTTLSIFSTASHLGTMIFSRDGSQLYYVEISRPNTTIVAINSSTGARVNSYKQPPNVTPVKLFLSVDDSRIYSFSQVSEYTEIGGGWVRNAILEVDTASFRLQRRYELHARTEAGAISPGHILIGSSIAVKISLLDLRTWKEEEHINVANHTSGNMAITPDHKRVYASNRNGHLLMVADMNTP
ncbi:YncE family protein, partial [Pseudomonas baetica]|uniref:YncE family protein n=1 Tax=Pseudomonas baetica TaxID=674054 RepID=UPI00287270D8